MSLSQTVQIDHAEHATMVFERAIPATVQAVFGAFQTRRYARNWEHHQLRPSYSTTRGNSS